MSDTPNEKPAQRQCQNAMCEQKFTPRGVGTSREQRFCSRECLIRYRTVRHAADRWAVRRWLKHYAEFHWDVGPYKFEDWQYNPVRHGPFAQHKSTESGGYKTERRRRIRVRIPETLKVPGLPEERLVWMDDPHHRPKRTLCVCDVVAALHPPSYAEFVVQDEQGWVTPPGDHAAIMGQIKENHLRKSFMAVRPDEDLGGSAGGKFEPFYYNTLSRGPAKPRRESRAEGILRLLREAIARDPDKFGPLP